jgi:hypothetical protein
MASDSIIISVTDKRNTTYTKSYPFIKYDKPKVEIIGVDNGIVQDDTIVVLPPSTTITLKATSIVGLSRIGYTIDGEEQVIYLNGDKEYTFSITIQY